MSAAARRITKEYAELQADFPPHVVAQPDESNLLHWVSSRPPSLVILGLFRRLITMRVRLAQTGTISGPPDSAYKGELSRVDPSFPPPLTSRLARVSFRRQVQHRHHFPNRVPFQVGTHASGTVLGRHSRLTSDRPSPCRSPNVRCFRDDYRPDLVVY